MKTLEKEELNILRDIKIHDILNIKNTGRDIRMPCPIHKGRNNNFNIYPDNSFHCFKCGVNGKGAIDFVVAMGYSFTEACEELIDYL